MVDEDVDVDADKDNKGADAAQQSSAGKEEEWELLEDLEADTPPPPTTTYSEQPGPTINLTGDAEPYKFFRLFFDDTLLEMIKDGTNEYARHRIAGKENTGS